MLWVSCGNNLKEKKIELEQLFEEAKTVKEKLDTNLVRGVLELIQSEEHLRYPEIPLNESFIIIGFGVIPVDSTQVFYGDSLVYITYFHHFFPIEEETTNYKGMLNINGHNIAIFDMGNFGNSYYNIDSLQQKTLNVFKRYPMKNTVFENYRVHNGQLIYEGQSKAHFP